MNSKTMHTAKSTSKQQQLQQQQRQPERQQQHPHLPDTTSTTATTTAWRRSNDDGSNNTSFTRSKKRSVGVKVFLAVRMLDLWWLGLASSSYSCPGSNTLLRDNASLSSQHAPPKSRYQLRDCIVYVGAGNP